MAGCWARLTVSLQPAAWQRWLGSCAGGSMPRRAGCCCGDDWGVVMSVVPFARAEAAFRASEMSITLLGATGSVRTSTIDLVRAQRDPVPLEAVTAPRNAGAPAKLARGPRAKSALPPDPHCPR